MSKWIAEFELEDGDTMPEHMDLNYMGAKIDFHCKPLEQKPKSEWEQDHAVLKAYSDGANEVLDKIRVEIEKRPYGIANDSVIQGMKYERVAILEILDKYKGESA